jgi:hypothetical protein
MTADLLSRETISELAHIGKAVWFGKYKPENWVMALTACFDDSGTDPANPSLVVAGFASTVEQWDRFTEEMISVEAEFNAPPFHSKEFDDARRGHGPYAKWGEAQRREYLNRILGIIARRTSSSFAVSLDKGAYEAIIGPQQAFREYFYSPFAFTAVNAIHATSEWRNRLYPGEPLLFIFDAGNRNEGQLKVIGDKALAGSDKLIDRILFGDDRQLAPLRAADLLAFELCSEARRVSNPKRSRQYSRHALQKLDDLPHDWIKVEEEALVAEIRKLIDDGTFIVDSR